jgi:hypothetical protein
MRRERSATALKLEALTGAVQNENDAERNKSTVRKRSGTQVWNLMHALAMKRAAGPILGERDMERLKEVVALLDAAQAERFLASILRRAMDNSLDINLLRHVLESVKPGAQGYDLKLDFLHDRKHARQEDAEIEEPETVVSTTYAALQWSSQDTLLNHPSERSKTWSSRLRRLRRLPEYLRAGLDLRDLASRGMFSYLTDREIEGLRTRFCKGMSANVSAPQILQRAAVELRKDLDQGERFGGVARLYARVSNHLLALEDAPPPSFYQEINTALENLRGVGCRISRLDGHENLAQIRDRILSIESFARELQSREPGLARRIARVVAHLVCRFYGSPPVDHCLRKGNYTLGLERYRREELISTPRRVRQFQLHAVSSLLMLGASDDPEGVGQVNSRHYYLGFNRGPHLEISRHQVSFDLSSDGSLMILNEGRDACIDVCLGDTRLTVERRHSSSVFGVRIGRDGEIVNACRCLPFEQAANIAGVLDIARDSSRARLKTYGMNFPMEDGLPPGDLEVIVYLPLRTQLQPVMIVAKTIPTGHRTEWRVTVYSGLEEVAAEAV